MAIGLANSESSSQPHSGNSPFQNSSLQSGEYAAWASGVWHHGEETTQKVLNKLPHSPTFRGVALLLFGLFLITGPVPEHSDLFAAVLGYSLIALVTVASVSTLLLGWKFRSKGRLRLTYDIAHHQSSEGQTSSGRPTVGEPTKLFLKISEANLQPLYSLEVVPEFEHPCAMRTWKIIGKTLPSLEAAQYFTPPHRGHWDVTGLRVTLRDTFGISQFRWVVRSENLPHISAYPKETFTRSLPIFTAETTSGIEQTELQRSEGDPYDVKRYHPSDGIRRILWKVYAKSGELLSRHPEPSMTPEGVVVMYVLAGKSDDRLASLALSHVRDLEAQQYEFFCSCDGAAPSHLAEANSSAATTERETEELLLSTVWQADYTKNAGRLKVITGLSELFENVRMSTLTRITFFVSVERLRDPNFYQEMELLQQSLHQQRLEALWIILDERSDSSTTNSNRRLSELLMVAEEKPARTSTESSENTLSRFAAHCELYGFPHIITR
ncbi:MAG: DUF58 domain-containing protein [Bdellovibrionales bacterium]|nr:DUF58 domain-containing protein [Bdellovibrionales bacterium]